MSTPIKSVELFEFEIIMTASCSGPNKIKIKIIKPRKACQ